MPAFDVFTHVWPNPDAPSDRIGAMPDTMTQPGAATMMTGRNRRTPWTLALRYDRHGDARQLASSRTVP
jgi:hypothetical protein